MGWLDFFKSEPATVERYQLVERTDGDTVHSGIKLLLPEYADMIVVIGEKVSLKEVDDHLKLDFTFDVVANPQHKKYTKDDLTPIIGDIIIELIEADYLNQT